MAAMLLVLHPTGVHHLRLLSDRNKLYLKMWLHPGVEGQCPHPKQVALEKLGLICSKVDQCGSKKWRNNNNFSLGSHHIKDVIIEEVYLLKVLTGWNNGARVPPPEMLCQEMVKGF